MYHAHNEHELHTLNTHHFFVNDSHKIKEKQVSNRDPKSLQGGDLTGFLNARIIVSTFTTSLQ